MEEMNKKEAGQISKALKNLHKQTDISSGIIAKLEQCLEPILSIGAPVSVSEEKQQSFSPLTMDLQCICEKVISVNCKINELLQRIEL